MRAYSREPRRLGSRLVPGRRRSRSRPRRRSLSDELEAAHRVRAGAGARLRGAPARDAHRPPGRDAAAASRLGHRHVPVGAVGAYVPGGRYPMLASAFMTVVVPKVAGVERRGGERAAARGRRDPPARCCTRWPRRAPTRSSAWAAFRRSRRWRSGSASSSRGHDRRRRERLRRRGQAPAVRQGRHRPARRADRDPRDRRRDADAELVAADLLGQAEHGPTSPAVLVTTSRELGAAVMARGRRCSGAGPRARSPGRRGATAARSSSRAIATRRSSIANRYAYEHVEVHAAAGRARRLPGAGCATTARCSSGSRRPWRSATRRSARTTCCRPPGAARYTGGLWVGKFLKTLTYQWLTEEGTRQIAPAAAAISDAELFPGTRSPRGMRLESGGFGAAIDFRR